MAPGGEWGRRYGIRIRICQAGCALNDRYSERAGISGEAHLRGSSSCPESGLDARGGRSGYPFSLAAAATATATVTIGMPAAILPGLPLLLALAIAFMPCTSACGFGVIS
jgi:hypothetical protein